MAGKKKDPNGSSRRALQNSRSDSIVQPLCPKAKRYLRGLAGICEEIDKTAEIGIQRLGLLLISKAPAELARIQRWAS